MVGWHGNFQTSALLTDLYQLTMAYGYWKLGVWGRRAAFHLFFRRLPFGGGFAVASGLESVVRFLEAFRFQEDDLAYLASLRDDRGAPLFPEEFLAFLADLRPSVDLDAVEEGRLVFPNEPLLRVEGPILECQLLETPLLNLLNFQTLVATKAARVCRAAGGRPVLEFGLRRAQGPDGALSAARAAYVGGVAATSNVLAGKLFGIPVKGTHAHSWVMFFSDEEEAFRKWLQVMPGNTVLLLDTYDTEAAAETAAQVGTELRGEGHNLAAVRIDSGNLAAVSRKVREILSSAGLKDTRIIASGDLDEFRIQELAHTPIDAWGVGTKLVTAHGDPALGGVYKLGAICEPDGHWRPVFKYSEDGSKTNLPGRVRVRRFRTGSALLGDVIYEEGLGLPEEIRAESPGDGTLLFRATASDPWEELLVPVFRSGRLAYELPELEACRARARAELEALPPAVAALRPAASYPVGWEHNYRKWRERVGHPG